MPLLLLISSHLLSKYSFFLLRADRSARCSFLRRAYYNHTATRTPWLVFQVWIQFGFKWFIFSANGSDCCRVLSWVEKNIFVFIASYVDHSILCLLILCCFYVFIWFSNLDVFLKIFESQSIFSLTMHTIFPCLLFFFFENVKKPTKCC